MLARICLFSLIYLLILPASASFAALQDSQAQLRQIRQRIEQAQSDLSQKKQSEIKLTRELALLKRTLQQIDRQSSELRKEQDQLKLKIDQQQSKIQSGKQSLRKVSQRVEKRLVALYKEGEVGPLKILFSADSPTELMQQYQYLTRVLQSDKQLLGEYRELLATQQAELAGLETLQQQQQQLLSKVEQQRKDAKEGRQLQSRLLAQVQRDKKKLAQELAELREKAERLQGLVADLKRKPQTQVAPDASEFTAGKGKLNWPVAGEVLIGYGTKKDPDIGTVYESNGFEIATRTDEPIRAVADGSVAFASWFKGYGNLLILSHAGGYHTLYAHADRLQRSIGDQVKAGDLLGYSGLRGRESIYFEIRHKGAPVDPGLWLKRRN